MINRLIAIAAVAVLAGVQPAVPAGDAWSYDGEHGPDHWGDLSEDFQACGQGQQQSPVNLTGAVQAFVPRIELHWTESSWAVTHTDHTLQLESADPGYILLGTERFDLVQFHFRTPSEHAIHDKRFPMEVQFVHSNSKGELAVIAVMMRGDGANSLFQTIMHLAPKDAGTMPLGLVNPRDLFTDLEAALHYRGSMTTPPCSEIVHWIVTQQPVSVAQWDIDVFRSLFPVNARPLQPLNRRFVLQR